MQRVRCDNYVSNLFGHIFQLCGIGLVGSPEVPVPVEVEALPPKILNMTVPQVGQRPLMALRPFFITSSTASAISFFALHLTQYPSAIIGCFTGRVMRSGSHGSTLRAETEQRQRLKQPLKTPPNYLKIKDIRSGWTQASRLFTQGAFEDFPRGITR